MMEVTMNDTQIRSILNSMSIICDSREHEHANDHILDYFSAHNIQFVRRKLDFGDYSFEIPDRSFETAIAIERKMNLTELSGNLCQNRERFEAEFSRAKEAGAKMILMIEDIGWTGILEHKYRTGLNEKSFYASLMAFQHRYDLNIQFVPKKYAGLYIYSTFYYYLREIIKDQEAAAV
jgi:ERCC4-type nuclease